MIYVGKSRRQKFTIMTKEMNNLFIIEQFCEGKWNIIS